MERRNHKHPSISVVTICRNASTCIEKTLQSILDQKYPAVESIIVDGDSSDSTFEIVKTYETEFLRRGLLFKATSEPDGGIYEAINKGIDRSTGDIISLLHAGDHFEEEALHHIANAYQFCTERKRFAYAASVRVLSSPTSRDLLRSQMPPLSPGNPKIQHVGIYLSKSIYADFGGYDTRYRLSSDYDLIARLCSHGLRFTYSDQITVSIAPYGVSADEKNRTRKIWEHCRVQFKYYSKVRSVTYALNRYFIWRLSNLRRGLRGSIRKILGVITK